MCFLQYTRVSLSVLVSIYVSVCVQISSFFQSAGKGMNPFQNKTWFLRVCSTRPLKTLLEKGKLLVTSNFSFSHSVFYKLRELSDIFVKFEIDIYKLLQFGGV